MSDGTNIHFSYKRGLINQNIANAKKAFAQGIVKTQIEFTKEEKNVLERTSDDYTRCVVLTGYAEKSASKGKWEKASYIFDEVQELAYKFKSDEVSYNDVLTELAKVKIRLGLLDEAQKTAIKITNTQLHDRIFAAIIEVWLEVGSIDEARSTAKFVINSDNFNSVLAKIDRYQERKSSLSSTEKEQKQNLTDEYNNALKFIEEATPDQLRRIEFNARKRLNEISSQASKGSVKKYLTLAKQKSGNILILEKFNGTSRSLSLDELKELNLLEYSYSPKVQDFLDSVLN